MALINLKTNLTSLKFGNDRPGYGSSNLPYIQTQIPGIPNSPGLFKPLYTPGSTGDLDFPIRGGGRGSVSIGLQTFTLASQLDKTRIRKFLEDQPRGPIFLRKQIGLQLTNPKMETGNTLFGSGQAAPIPGILENTRIYEPTGKLTLAQVAAMGSGAHAIRSGLVAFSLSQKHYFYMVNQQNVNNVGTTNRLVNLNALKMTTGKSPFVNPQNVFDIEKVNTLGISLNKNILFQYQGGPGSVYGAGSTTISRVVDTTNLGVTVKKFAGRTGMVYDQLKTQKINRYVEGTATTNIQDFYQARVSSDPQVIKYNAEVDRVQKKLEKKPNNKRLQDRLAFLQNNPPDKISGKTPKPWGNNTIDQRFYVGAGNYKDKLNSSLPFLFNNSILPWKAGYETDDLIKFVFEAISNDDPNYSVAIFFRAFLTAGITDNHSAQLSPFRYLGRGENFYTYQGFDRSVSFSFRVAAGSKEELIPMYNRLNTLISQVYPDYSRPGNIMRAPIVRLTIGDYFYRVPGFLESVNITVDNGSPWEINLDGDLAQLPQVVNVSVSFKPILDELPRRTSTVLEVLSKSQVVNGEVTEQVNIDTDVPQLIANNGSVIRSKVVGATQYSSIRRATEADLSDDQAKVDAINPNIINQGQGTQVNLG